MDPTSLNRFALLLLLSVVCGCICPAQSVPLGLGALSQCTFHLVHFYDTDMSESILTSNHHGQPWTVHNVSRSLAQPGPSFSTNRQELEDGSLHLDESRICNVHLLVQPVYETVPELEAYPNSLAVQSWASTFFVRLTRRQLLL